MNVFVISAQYNVPLTGTNNVTSTPVVPTGLIPQNPIFYLMIVVFIGIVLAIIGFVLWAIKSYMNNKREKRSYESVLFEIRIAQSNEIEISAAEQMFSGLSSISEGGKLKLSDYISFEIVAFPESIRMYVSCPKELKELVEKQILGSYPPSEVVITDEYNIFSEGASVSFESLKLKKDNHYPIQTYNELAIDGVGAIFTSMSKLTEGESTAVQILITPSSDTWRDAGIGYLNKVKDYNSDPEKKNINVPEDVLRGIEMKCSKTGFATNVRLVAVGQSKAVSKTLLSNLIGTFEQFSRPNMNKFSKYKFKKLMPWERKQFVFDFLFRYPNAKQASVLTVDELATIFHLPNKEITVPNIHWLKSKRAPAAAEVPDEGSIWLGTNIYRGKERSVYFDNVEDRLRHMYVVGKTGSGKSYFIQSMALQDIMNGNGVAFMDPHGDAIEWIMDRIPPERIEDVIVFDPSDTERPVAFNIMEAYNEQDRHRVVNAFIGLLIKLFDPNGQGIVGPRLERAVRNAMLTAMEAGEGYTLVEVVRILISQKFVDKLIPKIKDEMVKQYWTEEQAQTAQYHKSEILGYIVSKFDRFVTNKLMRNIIGQSKSSFDFRKVMDEQKILLINLSKGIIGEENAQFLGLLIVPKILSAAMSRADIDKEDRKPFFLYVDEFQNFATEDFAQILSEARKYGLGLIVANQYISQVQEKIRDAVFGNIGSIVSFKVGVNDAQYLKNEFYPVFDENDLVNLENVNAYVKLLINSEYPTPFSISTWFDKSRFPSDKKTAEMIRQLSRLRYGRDRELVEAEMAQRGAEEESTPGPDLTPPPSPF